MELKVIQRANHTEEEIIAKTSLEEGIFTGVVRTTDKTKFADKVGQYVLLQNVSSELVQKVKSDPVSKPEELIRPNPNTKGAFILQIGVEGVICETIDRHGDLVGPEPLAFGTFIEYVPYAQLKSMPPLYMPSDTGL